MLKTLLKIHKKAIKYLFYHEVAHSVWTIKDHKELQTKLNIDKIPYGIYNLFEDARIEHLARERFNIDFEWESLHSFYENEAVKNPMSMFYYLIYMNGNIKKLNNIALDSFNDPKHEIRKNVIKFYERCIEAKDTLSLVPILKNWMDFVQYDEFKSSSIYYDLSYDEEAVTDEYQQNGFDGVKNRYLLQEISIDNEEQEEFSNEDYRDLFNIVTREKRRSFMYTFSSKKSENSAKTCNLLYEEELKIKNMQKKSQDVLEHFTDLFRTDQIKYNQPSAIVKNTPCNQVIQVTSR
jgi:hypothetical protein